MGAFGALGVGGIAAFVIGSLMMFPAHTPGFALSTGFVAGAAIGSAVLLLFVLAALLRSRRRPVVTGSEALIGAEGETCPARTAKGAEESRAKSGWHARTLR